MTHTPSRTTITEYLPIIRAVYAAFDVRLAEPESLERRQKFDFMYLGNVHGHMKVAEALSILKSWIQGSGVTIQSYAFVKDGPQVQWTPMLVMIEGHLKEYGNGGAVITLTLSRSGRVAREVGGATLFHDFEGDGLRTEILLLLAQEKKYVATKEICRIVGSKSTASISKMIEVINSAAEQNLQLPANQKLIESKRGSGYRINPIYNLVLVE